MTDTDQLDVLAAAATPGPWRASGLTIWKPLHPDDATDFGGHAIAWVTTSGDVPTENDAAFIVALVNAYRAGELMPAPDRAGLREAAPDIFDRLMELWQQPWSEPAFGEAQVLVARLRAALHREDGA